MSKQRSISTVKYTKKYNNAASACKMDKWIVEMLWGKLKYYIALAKRRIWNQV